MTHAPRWWQEARRTGVLAVPIIAGQVGQMLMGVLDTLMVGQLGVVPLGAAALANGVFSVFLMGGMGLISAVAVLVAQAKGANDEARCGHILSDGLRLAFGVGLILAGAITAILPGLSQLGQPPEIVVEARLFLFLIGWSTVPLLLFQVCKHFSEALSCTWPPLIILAGGLGLNAILNWFLIYGHAGFPALGLAGAGWATLIARVVILFVLYFFVTRSKRFIAQHRGPRPRAGGDRTYVSILRLGLPVSGQLLCEVGAFAVAAIVMGWFNAQALAAHQIAINCAATAFMVPMGLALATTVRIGQAVGAAETGKLRSIALGSWALVAGFVGVTTVLFSGAGRFIAGWFIQDEATLVLATRMLMVAAIFQCGDAMQVVSTGALRGLGDVRIPTVMAFAAYWILALPVGYGLAWGLGWGPVGVWWGLALGLMVAAWYSSVRFWHLTRSPLKLDEAERVGECVSPWKR